MRSPESRTLSFFTGITVLSALSPTTGAQVGSVVHSQKLNELFGGFAGVLSESDQFGSGLGAVGDVDGDGVDDLAVGAVGDDDGGPDRGAIWILFMNPDGTVRTQSKISQTQGGFAGVLSDVGAFGRRVVGVGDLDGNGVPDLATVSGRPNRLWVLFLDSSGAVIGHVENQYSDPVFVPPTTARSFAFGGLASLGDLDGDGVTDLAIGAPDDPSPSDARGAVWIVRLHANGTLKAAHEIGEGQGGFTGVLANDSRFGHSVALLGDLDGDGNRELGVRSPGGPFFGQFWVLFMDANERVSSQTAFEFDEYGLPVGNHVFGVPSEYAWLGDIDGDGQGELAMEFAYEDFPGGPSTEGGLAVGAVRADGTLRKRTRISNELGGLGPIGGGSGFGSPITFLGDLDNDGRPEIAVGAPTERAAGLHKGAVWILELAETPVRNGSGVNPLNLSQSADPSFGSPWTLNLDCSGHGAGLAVVFGTDTPFSGLFLPVGEVLITGQLLFRAEGPHGGGVASLVANVPPVAVELLDLPVFTQGLCLGAPGARVGNALDVILGE